MAKKLFAVTVRGKQYEWNFKFYGNPKYLQDWRDDGLEIYEIENRIPSWIVDTGLARVWCFFQDLFQFKNPLKR